MKADDFRWYQEAAARTIKADMTRDDKLSNFGLGLAGEAAEVMETIDRGLWRELHIDVQALKLELGDVLWYVAGTCSALELDMANVVRAVATTDGVGGETRAKDKGLMRNAIALGIEAGQAADLIKKALYHGKRLDEVTLKVHLGAVVLHVGALCWIAQLALHDVAQANIDKLMKRWPGKFGEPAPAEAT